MWHRLDKRLPDARSKSVYSGFHTPTTKTLAVIPHLRTCAKQISVHDKMYKSDKVERQNKTNQMNKCAARR